MELKYQSDQKSVKKFDDIQISDFSIFTGKNGSGKTHILHAIKNGNITVDNIPKNKILSFNYLDFEHDFQTRAVASQKNTAWTRLRSDNGNDLVYQLRNPENHIDGLRDTIQNIALAKEKAIFELKKEDLPETNAEDILRALKLYKDELESLLSNENFINEDLPQSVYDSVVLKSSYFLSSTPEEDFMSLFQKTAISGRKILSDLSNIFIEYHRNIDRNILKEAKGGTYLDDAAFIKKFGVPPWELIREIFLDFNINFDINDPIEDRTDSIDGSFQIKFKNLDKGILVPFTDLSSGERILITLVNAIYTVRRRDGLPELIMLDEIDGPLNPSIIKKFLTYIKDNFADKGIKVIVATHSPSTVAFAPENSIYVINTNEEIPIKSKTNQEAVAILSEGFTTIEDLLKLTTITQTKIIVSEGYNYNYLEKARTVFAPEDAELAVLKINIGGTPQLRVMFDLMRHVTFSKSFIFVFDCDYFQKEQRGINQEVLKDQNDKTLYEDRNLQPCINNANGSNRFFIFSKNDDSDSLRGIENLFPKASTSGFQGSFDEKGPKGKLQFEKYILERNNSDDFVNFKEVFDFIETDAVHNITI